MSGDGHRGPRLGTVGWVKGHADRTLERQVGFSVTVWLYVDPGPSWPTRMTSPLAFGRTALAWVPSGVISCSRPWRGADCGEMLPRPQQEGNVAGARPVLLTSRPVPLPALRGWSGSQCLARGVCLLGVQIRVRKGLRRWCWPWRAPRSVCLLLLTRPDVVPRASGEGKAVCTQGSGGLSSGVPPTATVSLAFGWLSQEELHFSRPLRAAGNSPVLMGLPVPWMLTAGAEPPHPHGSLLSLPVFSFPLSRFLELCYLWFLCV